MSSVLLTILSIASHVVLSVTVAERAALPKDMCAFTPQMLRGRPVFGLCTDLNNACLHTNLTDKVSMSGEVPKLAQQVGGDGYTRSLNDQDVLFSEVGDSASNIVSSMRNAEGWSAVIVLRLGPDSVGPALAYVKDWLVWNESVVAGSGPLELLRRCIGSDIDGNVDRCLSANLMRVLHFVLLVDGANNRVILVSSMFAEALHFVVPALFDSRWHLLGIVVQPLAGNRYVRATLHLDGAEPFRSKLDQCSRLRRPSSVAPTAVDDLVNELLPLRTFTNSSEGLVVVGGAAGSYHAALLFREVLSRQAIAAMGTLSAQRAAAGGSPAALLALGMSLIGCAFILLCWAKCNSLRMLGFVSSCHAFSEQMFSAQVHHADTPPPVHPSEATMPSLAGNVVSVGGKHGAAIVAQASSALSVMKASQIPVAATASAVAVSIASLGLQVPQQMSVLFASISFPIGFREVFSNVFSVVSVRFDLPEVTIPPYAPLIVVVAGVVVVGAAMTTAVRRDRVEFLDSLRRWDERLVAYRILLRNIVRRALDGTGSNEALVKDISLALGSSFPPQSDFWSQGNLTTSLSHLIEDESSRDRVVSAFLLQCPTLLETLPQDTVSLLCLCTIPQLPSEKIGVSDIMVASEKLQMLLRSFDMTLCAAASITMTDLHNLVDRWAVADECEEFSNVVAGVFTVEKCTSNPPPLTEERMLNHVNSFVTAILSWMVEATAGNTRAFVSPFLEWWHEVSVLMGKEVLSFDKSGSSPPTQGCAMNSRDAARFHWVLRQQHHAARDMLPPFDRAVPARRFHHHSSLGPDSVVTCLAEHEVRHLVASSRAKGTFVPTTASYCCPLHERFLVPATTNHIKAVTLDGRPMYRCCNADSDEVKQVLHTTFHTKGDACDDGEVFVCPDQRCAFTLCGICLSREVGWFDRRVRIPIAGVIYVASHMSPPLLSVMSVIVLEALLFPITQIPLLVLTCSPQIGCWFRDCYTSWNSEFVASFVLAIFLLACRLAIALSLYTELLARQGALSALLGDASSAKDRWAYFLSSCDRSLLRSLYIGTKLDVMALEPIVRLVMDVGIVLAASLPDPDSILQKCVIGLLYAGHGLFLGVANPNVLPSLNDLAKMVSVHQLVVMGLSAIFDSVSIGDAEGSSAADGVMVVMIVVTASFLVFVATVAWSAIGVPFVEAKRRNAMEALIRRESQAHSLPDDPASVGKKVFAMIQTFQEKKKLSAALFPWHKPSVAYGASQVAISAAILLEMIQKMPSVSDRSQLLSALDNASLSEGALVKTVSQWLEQIAGYEYLRDDEDSPFSLSSRQLLSHECAALGAFIVTHGTDELRSQLMRVGPTVAHSFVHCNQLQLLASGAITQHLDFHSAHLRTCKLVRGTVIRNSNFSAASMASADMPRCSLVACNLRGAKVSPLSFVARIPVLRVIGHKDAVNCAAFSADGTLIATGSDDKSVRLWSASSGAELAVLNGHSDGLRFLVFSPDRRCLATCSRDKSVRIWDLNTFSSTIVLTGHTDAVRAVCFSPDGVYLLSGGRDKTIRIWSTANGELSSVLNGHSNVVTSLAITPNGLLAVSGSDDCTARLWDIKVGSEVRVFHGHSDAVNSVAVARDGQVIVTASRDKSLRLWGIDSATALKVLMGHSGVINCAAFSFDGLRIVSGSDDKSVRVWDAASGDEIAVLVGSDVVRSVAFSCDGTRLVAALYKTVALYDVASAIAETNHSGHVGEVNSVSFARDGEHFASTGADKTVRVWSANDGQLVVRFPARSKSVCSVTFSPDGTRLAFVDNTVRIIDVTKGSDLITITGHQSAVTCVVFAARAQCIASGSFDKTARTWSASNGTPIAVLQGHLGTVTAVAISADGLRLASGSDDKTVRIWDCASNAQLFCLSGHVDAVKCVALSDDASFIISGSRDRTLRIWNTLDGSLVRIVQGHESAITSVALASDGSAAVSGSVDKTVRLWNVKSGECTAVFKGHTRSVRGVAWSNDNIRVLSCSDDGTVRMWPVPGNSFHAQSLALGDDNTFLPCSELLVIGGTVPLQSVAL